MKAHFVGNPRPIGIGRYVWKTSDVTKFVSADGKEFVMPEDFIYDGCTAPWLVRWAFPPDDGLYGRAVALHDYLVRFRYKLGLSLADCHGYFAEALRVCGVGSERAKAMYLAVYMFNWTIAPKGDGSLPSGLMKRVKLIDLRPA